MKKLLFVTVVLVLVVAGFALTSAAQGQGKVQACVALGFEADVCATCVVAGIGNNAQDYGACFCKYDEAMRARFNNMGECVAWVQKNLR